MRLIGPNCLGVISPANRVILCSSPALDVGTLPVGRIGLVSQSERAIATAPVTPARARALLASLAIWPVLTGYRGQSLAVAAVVDALVRVSWLAHDLGEADFELDVNPMLVNERTCCTVDARLRRE